MVLTGFPWVAVPSASIPDSGQLVDRGDRHISDAVVLNHKYILYYFSAHWYDPLASLASLRV